ncbi:MAG: hypothetical protein D6723_03335 [Acidobacteria bacterium]|nr:MAG: hypothetical protein D6723_03335 [Acidobacteriota bacterium]
MDGEALTEVIETNPGRQPGLELHYLLEPERVAVPLDTAHEVAHYDWCRRDGSCEKIDLEMGFADALTYAQRDLRENGEAHRRRRLGA